MTDPVPTRVPGWFAVGRVPSPWRDVEVGPFGTPKAAALEGRRRRFGGLKIVYRDQAIRSLVDEEG